jgi:hypothetical protein
MRVIHEVPAPRELASMVRSFLYFQICCRFSEMPQFLEVTSNEPESRDRSKGQLDVHSENCLLTS